MKRTVSAILVVLMGLLFLYGCGSKEVKPSGVQPQEWVINGSGAFGG
jgi:hypothetical protein